MFLLIFACASACTSVGVREEAVLGGDVDDGDPAVVSLAVNDASLCSGTLVSPWSVLTAGHCLLDGDVVFGTDVTAPVKRISIAAGEKHPMFTAEGAPYDLALVTLKEPATDIRPIALDLESFGDDDVGQPMRHVGFGVTSDSTGDGRGTKRTVSYPLNRVDATKLFSGATGEQTCNGDSGGPAFMTRSGGKEALVGVVSDGPSCDDPGDGWDARIDIARDWLEATIDRRSTGGCDLASGNAPTPWALLVVLGLFWWVAILRRVGR